MGEGEGLAAPPREDVHLGLAEGLHHEAQLHVPQLADEEVPLRPVAPSEQHVAGRLHAPVAVHDAVAAVGVDARAGVSPAHAEQLLALHRRTYPTYWKWVESAVAFAMLTNRLHSIFGWVLQVDEQLGPRTIQNFPMQANGAEMLRLACCLTTESQVEVCMPVHDALLIANAKRNGTLMKVDRFRRRRGRPQRSEEPDRAEPERRHGEGGPNSGERRTVERELRPVLRQARALLCQSYPRIGNVRLHGLLPCRARPSR